MQNTISFNTKFGWISASEKKNRITSINFIKTSKNHSSSRILNKLKKKINLYFKGRIRFIKIPLDIPGNSLQKKVFRELKKIKKGQTRSYAEIAKKVKVSPRYIGKICSQNQHLLLIPCHRVIGSNDSLTGFSAKGGINLKRKLLLFEKNDSIKK